MGLQVGHYILKFHFAMLRWAMDLRHVVVLSVLIYQLPVLIYQLPVLIYRLPVAGGWSSDRLTV